MLLAPYPVPAKHDRSERASQPVHGELHLRFRATERNGQPLTVVDTLAHKPPLQIVRSFRLADGGALVHLHNLSGGVLGGDQLHTTIAVEAGARAQITTTGATRIYRQRAGHKAAEQELIAHVGQDALLEYLPDPVIPYAGSAYSQRTRFVLAEGAGLFAWDIFAPGRTARGECFAYDQLAWETTVEVVTGDAVTPIAIERACLEPARRPLTASARLGPFRYPGDALCLPRGDRSSPVACARTGAARRGRHPHPAPCQLVGRIDIGGAWGHRARAGRCRAHLAGGAARLLAGGETAVV